MGREEYQMPRYQFERNCWLGLKKPNSKVPLGLRIVELTRRRRVESEDERRRRKRRREKTMETVFLEGSSRTR